MPKRFRSKRKTINIRTRGLILCEEKTECNYFLDLIDQPKYRRQFSSIDVHILQPKNHSPVGLVKAAKAKVKAAKSNGNAYEFAWVVFDKDGHANIPGAFETARTARPAIQIAFSAPCFELFVLLHFEKTARPFPRCKDAYAHLKSKWLQNYEKANETFALLLPKHKTGLKNCEWLMAQHSNELNNGRRPYELAAFTNVHQLVATLYACAS